MAGINAAYVFPGGNREVGFWGGVGITGFYREFDYYVSFAKNGFRVALWDIYNFSSYDDPYWQPANRRIFYYRGDSTLHFLDLTVAYNFGDKFPLDVSVSTILYGRDRNVFQVRDGVQRRADQDRYTTYIQLTYPVHRGEKTTVKLYAAGAFALNGEGTPFVETPHFYGSKPNIVNAGVEVSQVVNIKGYEMPASATAMWNPEANLGMVQLALTLF